MDGEISKRTILALLLLTIVISFSSTFVTLSMLEQEPVVPQPATGPSAPSIISHARLSLNIGPNTPPPPQESMATGKLLLSIKGG
jgi:hypothetical protein